ncbi:AMP-binding protein [Bosea sp. ASV33]|uniref:AMP-binding protein n=1 Tax=Bosea sp. ASV33 TaxID=2795106 RepID=UPI0018EAF21F|nr:AMP-binding protein [Bosea sp. ASV33]
MNAASGEAWQPSSRQIAEANVTEIARLLGVADFDALQRVSVEDPAAYWKVINDYCRIVWSKPYERYADLSRGKQFPQWFIGGELNWTDSVFAWCDRDGGASRPAVIAESEDGSVKQVTYAELRQRVERFAAGLKVRGIGRGDRVGLLMESGVEATISFLAIAHLGAIVVPLFSGFGSDAIVSRLGACEARAIIATAGFHRRGKLVDTSAVVIEACKRLPTVERVILKAAIEHSPQFALSEAWSAVEQDAPKGFAAERMGANDPFMVIYTSGTTGRPKGAVHVHGGLPLKIAHDSAVHFDVKPGDVFFWPADMGWIAGALIICSTLMRGATLVCYDGAPDFPDWSRMSQLVERHKVTQYGSAPTLIRGLAAHEALAAKGDLSSVRLLITAGEGIDPEHFLWYQRHFGRDLAPVINYTGGTEVSGALLSSVIVKPILPTAFNTASPGVSIDVVDPQGNPISETVGELAVREPFVGMTKSFWQDDARYLETYWSAVPGLWLHGDLAIRLREGGFMLRGRSDDTIKVAGKRLGPAEVEEVVLELPGVNEAAAIGVDDPVKGQKLVVFVVPSDKTGADIPKEVSAHIDIRLGRPFRPSHVHVVAMLPKTKSSKVMRRVIRSLYSGQPAGDLSSVDNEAALDEIRRVAPPA